MRQLMQEMLCALVVGVNIRVHPGEAEALRNLGESYLKRPIHPLIIRTDKTLLDGTRRVVAMRMILGEKSDHLVDCFVTDEELSHADIYLINMESSIHRADLSGYEKWQGCLKLLEHHPDWTQKELAAQLNLDPAMVTRILSPSKCLPAVQEALKGGAVSISDCYAMSRSTEQQQHELLAAKLNGSSAADVAHRARKARNGTPAIKVSKLRCPLPSGAVVQVTLDGDGGLEECINACQEFLREARKAVEQGLDPKTLERVLKDKASKE